MVRFVLHRLLRALITLVLFQTLLFFLFQAMPGDFVSTLIGLPQPMRQGLRRALGLADPLWQQYLRWMGAFFTGQLGTTLRFPHESVGRILWALVPRTLFLFLPASFLSVGLGYWVGKYLGGRRRGGGKMAAALTAGAILTYTAFPPWLAFLLVQVFAVRLNWFPAENVISAGRWAGITISADTVILYLLLTAGLVGAVLGLISHLTRRRARRPLLRWAISCVVLGGTVLAWYLSGWGPLALDLLWHLILPLTAVVLLSFGEPMLLMRLSMLQVASEDHVQVARAKGLPARTVRDRHIARLALLPVLARFLIQLPFVLLGSLVVEMAFYWKGIGRELLLAIDMHDLPVVMGVFSIVGTWMLLSHLLLDILHAWLDPRVRAAMVPGRLPD